MSQKTPVQATATARTKPRARRTPAAPRRETPAAPPAIRLRILAAALTLFARSGFDGVTISQVAREAKVASPLIYYHFQDKEELWRAAADYAIAGWSESARLLTRELSDADPLTRLKVLVRRLIYFSAQNREFGGLVMNEAGAGAERMDWLIERHIRPLHGSLSETLEEAMAAGQIRRCEPAFFTAFLMGGVSRFMNSGHLLQTLYALDPAERETVDHFSDFVIDLLFKGLTPDAQAS